jgi:hypothetical protein
MNRLYRNGVQSFAGGGAMPTGAASDGAAPKSNRSSASWSRRVRWWRHVVVEPVVLVVDDEDDRVGPARPVAHGVDHARDERLAALDVGRRRLVALARLAERAEARVRERVRLREVTAVRSGGPHVERLSNHRKMSTVRSIRYRIAPQR